MTAHPRNGLQVTQTSGVCYMKKYVTADHWQDVYNLDLFLSLIDKIASHFLVAVRKAQSHQERL